MFIKIICAWCGRFMGIKEAEKALLPISHGICCNCSQQLLEQADQALQRYHETQNIPERR